MSRGVAAIIGAIAGGVITALAIPLLRPAPKLPLRDALTVEGAAEWTYHKGGVWIGDLTISASHKGLPFTAPGASVTIRNDTDNLMLIAVMVALYDAEGELLAVARLAPEPQGHIRAGETRAVATWLPVPSGDVADVRYVKLRVTRAALHRMPGGGQTL